MIVLATVCDDARVAVALDLETGWTFDLPSRPEFTDPAVEGRLQCRPFGITWHDGELYIANNRQLLVFDERLAYVRTEPIVLQINTHQAAHHGERIWVVSPWTNSLIGVRRGLSTSAIELDLVRQVTKPYVPRQARERDDVNHFNSLLWADSSLFVAAHNFNSASFILSYDDTECRLKKVYHDVGFSIHGLALSDGELYWISTLTNEIRSDRGVRVALAREGFARGLALTKDFFIVAISQKRGRSYRNVGDAWIQVLTRSGGSTVAEYALHATGDVNDIRIIDEYDFAHGVPPFWPVGSNVRRHVM